VKERKAFSGSFDADLPGRLDTIRDQAPHAADKLYVTRVIERHAYPGGIDILKAGSGSASYAGVRVSKESDQMVDACIIAYAAQGLGDLGPHIGVPVVQKFSDF
jgi:hypothetical protein